MPASTSSKISTGTRVGRREHDLEREHRARELAARGDAGERPGILARVGREEELGLVDALGTEPPRLGSDPELALPGPLPGQPHPEHRALEVERGELGQHRGLEPADGLIAPLGEVRGARDQLGAEPLHALRQAALVLAGAREPLQVGLEPGPERQDRLHALPVLPLEAPDRVEPPSIASSRGGSKTTPSR